MSNERKMVIISSDRDSDPITWLLTDDQIKLLERLESSDLLWDEVRFSVNEKGFEVV